MHARPFSILIHPELKMSDLIDIDYHLLLVINRFNIPLGFADKTVREVCALNEVDMDCFITIAQFLINPDVIDAKSFSHLNPASILAYLRNSHAYFMNERLPDIGNALRDILKDADENHRFSILTFFDEYFNEVQEHMNYENNIVFPYIDKLLAKKSDNLFTIDEFTSRHSNIEEKINDLKHLIIKYIPLHGDNYKITNVLFDLFLSEEDLNTHCFIEDKVLVPLVRKIEKEQLNNNTNE